MKNKLFMKRKGFTVVELMAVIAVLAIILAVTMPTINKVIESSKNRACLLDVGMMEKAARNYAHAEGVSVSKSKSLVVPLPLLQTKKYVSLIYNPSDRIEECEGYVVINNDNGNYKYKGYLKCGDTCKTVGYDDTFDDPILSDTINLQDKNGAKYAVGANPNNWVKFGRIDQSDNYGLLWRIIKVDDDGIKMVYEGRENGGVTPAEDGRIVLNNTSGIAWDTAGFNKWEAPASLKAQLNNWLSNIVVSNIDTYAIASTWSIGGVPYNDPTLTSTFVQYQGIDSIDTGGTFKGKTINTSIIGMIYASDFISTSSNVSCVGSYREIGSGNECAFNSDDSLNNFLYKNKYHYWTMNARSDVSNRSWMINNAGQVATAFTNSSIISVRPVINIKKDLTFYTGTGTVDDPYILEQYMVGLADKPSMTLNGINPYVMKEGDTYIEEGVKAVDKQDGDISSTVVITSDINVNVPGNYTVTYNVKDSNNNEAFPITRDVIVVEKDRPILNLKGSNPTYVTLNHAYVEPGFTAIDLNDGDISSDVVVTGNVNTSVLGVYELKYNVTNSQNKAAIEITRKVIVEVPKPVITLNGESKVLVDIGSTYTELGANAIDEIDGNLTSSIVRTIYKNGVKVSSVNGEERGSYKISYQVTNSLGGSTIVYRYVDVVSVAGPNITFSPNGDNTPKSKNKITATITDNKFPVDKGTVRYLWVKAGDNLNGTLENLIKYPYSSGTSLDTPKGTGNYYLYVIAKDTYKNVTIAKSNAFLLDNSNPVIRLKGSSIVNLLINSIYTDEGATAYDEYYDGDLTDDLVITSTVNPSLPGTYFVTYNVSDSAGNATTIKRRVNVNNPVPLITVTGMKEIDVRIGTSYVDQGATATDPIDGDITSSIIESGIVDTSTVGTYTITYSVTNSFGVETTATRRVNVYMPKPVITILGNNPKSIIVGTTYTDEGATATDEVDGDVTSNITSSGTVNPNLIGTYTVTYSVTNSLGGTKSVSRTVIVRNPETTITLNGNNPYTMDVASVYSEPGATATDEKDGDITDDITITTNLNPNIVGTYNVTYSVTNSVGITKTASRTIKVIPLAGPNIALSPVGDSTYKKTNQVTITVTQNKRPVDPTTYKYLWTDSLSKPSEASFTNSFASGDTINTLNTMAGRYYLHVLAKDIEGNTSIFSSNSFAIDTKAPVITINGESPAIFPLDGVYSDAGAVATDEGGGLNASGLGVTSDVVPTIVGTYHVTYTATDKAGNTTTVRRTVIVREVSLAGAIDEFTPKYYADYFVGTNPNNWIEFGAVSAYDERPLLWRIVKSDTDGIKIIYEGIKSGVSAPTENGILKLDGVDTTPYDTGNSNKWNTPVSLSSKLQTWYTNLYEPDKDILVNPINWCIGGVDTPYSIDDFKEGECLTSTKAGGTFDGKTTGTTSIGLLNSSDYMLTTSSGTCNAYNSTGCASNNFLSKSYDYLTMNADAISSSNVFAVKANAGLMKTSANTSLSIRPVINLKSNVLILGGEGTLESPYKLNNRPATFDVTAPSVTFVTNGNAGYAKTASTVVNVIDNKALNTDELKYLWSTSTTEPAYSEFANTFASGNNISCPANISGEYYLWIYAKDIYDNVTIVKSNVFHVDNVGPTLLTTITSDKPLDVYATATTDYGDATTKQYKLGTTGTWTNYTEAVTLSSYDVINGNLGNADKTVTYYVKGVDQYGNETIQSYVVTCLDLNKPSIPVITSGSGYPLLGLNGISTSVSTSVTYDSRDDITNYYSADGGTTWLPYTGSFAFGYGTVMAKSVVNASGLTSYTVKTISAPADAMTINAYDGNDSTYIATVTNKLLQVDSAVQGKKIRYKIQVTTGNTSALIFFNSSMQEISRISRTSNTFDEQVVVPANTKWIRYDANINNSNCRLYEINLMNEPTFTPTNVYALLHTDSNQVINNPYQMVTINYFSTSVQKLYQIDSTTGTWLEYTGPIKVNQGQVLYAKGIDANGVATRLIPSHTANVTDGMKIGALDGNDTTYIVGVTNQLLQVDSSVQGKKIRYKLEVTTGNTTTLRFFNSSMQEISNIARSGSIYTGNLYDEQVVVPTGTKWIRYDANINNASCRLYEINLMNEPTFTPTNVYALLHTNPAQSINSPYQMVTINYFSTSVQKLYQIGSTTGTWLEYTAPVKVNQGQVLYAKGVDSNGVPTWLTPSHTADITDGMKPPAYDGDYSTYIVGVTNQLLQVDSTVQGKTIRYKLETTIGNTSVLRFLNSSMQEISNVTRSGSVYTGGLYDEQIVVPVGTKWIKYEANINNGNCRLYEIAILP